MDPGRSLSPSPSSACCSPSRWRPPRSRSGRSTSSTTRLKPGDTVWVTDAQGREIKGKITSLAAEALALKADGSRTFSAADVRLVEERRGDSLLNGGSSASGLAASGSA